MMRIVAAVCGVEVQEYKNDRIKDTAYMGYREVAATREMIDQIYKEQNIDPAMLDVPMYQVMKSSDSFRENWKIRHVRCSDVFTPIWKIC